MSHLLKSLCPPLGALLLAWLLIPATAGAAEPPAIDSGDTAWVLVATALVLFMTIPGLSLLYAGMVRAKNALSIFMQCFAITSLVTVLWMAYGYSLAFDTTGQSEGQITLHSFIGSFSKAFLAGVTPTSAVGTIPESVFICFQLTFAIITPALIISAFAERVKFSAIMIFTAIWLTVVYLPICHMTWSGPGALFVDFGVFDFAGGCVVETCSGVSGLVAALVVGRRMGYPHTPMLPHSVALAVVGGGMLWVGWFGFNAGSAVSAGGKAGMAMLTTHVASAVAACVWMGIEWIRFGKPSALGIVTGSLAGLVAITPACGYVELPGAMAIGASACVACYLFVSVLKRRFGYDDTLDVFGVHGIGGIVGTILLACFATEAMVGKPVDMAAQLWAQTKSVAITIAWAAAGTFIVIKLIDLTMGLRVPPHVEAAGVDLDQHNEVAYSLEERV
ncbi:MAG: ammonium transporter [Planctomycetes bacterium]|nr:ammonium transporter [Planctomycetota bacterium]